jgi:hypothetical protein
MDSMGHLVWILVFDDQQDQVGVIGLQVSSRMQGLLELSWNIKKQRRGA